VRWEPFGGSGRCSACAAGAQPARWSRGCGWTPRGIRYFYRSIYVLVTWATGLAASPPCRLTSP